MTLRALATNAFWSATCQLLYRGSMMLSAVILARRVETWSFAAYSYYQLTISMLAAYAAMGLGIASARFFAEAGLEGKDRPVPALGTLWALSAVLAILAFVLVLAIPGGWLSAGLGVPRWLLATGVLVLALQVVPDGAIIGLERYRQAAVIAAVAGAVPLAGAYVAGNTGDVRWGMWALIVGSLIQSCGEAFIVIRAVGWRRIVDGVVPRIAEVQKVLRLSGPMFLVSLMSASGGWIVGRAILAMPGGKHEFALFTIGLQWFALAMFVPGVLARVLLPGLVRNAADAAGPRVSRGLVRTAIFMTTGAAAVIAVAGVALGPWILQMYGSRYRSDGSVIAVYLAAAVVAAPVNSIGNALVARDGQVLWLGLTALWAGALVCAAFILRAFGAIGGGAAYAIAYIMLTAGAILTARRQSVL